MNKPMIIFSIGILCLVFSFSAFSQEAGIASYYHDGLTGYKMANGARYNPNELTCAHPTAPLGSIMKIARKDNPNISVIVTVSDRGPYVDGRIIDLSKRAACELDILDSGITEVVVALIKKPSTYGIPLLTFN
jgi:rare lipoprotein A